MKEAATNNQWYAIERLVLSHVARLASGDREKCYERRFAAPGPTLHI